MTWHVRVCAAFFLMWTAGCVRQPWTVGISQTIPVSVAPVINDSVFDEIGPLAYQTLYQHLLHVGYCVQDKSSGAYQMQLQVLHAAPVQKFVTPDVVLVAQQIKLDLELTVKDAEGRTVASKRQQLLTLAHKPRDPSLMNSFTYTAYQQGLDQLVPRLELAVREPVLQTISAQTAALRP